MKKIISWLLPALLAVLFVPGLTSMARAGGENPAMLASNKAMGQQQKQDLRYQRQRIKQSGKYVRAEARESGHHNLAPKAVHHQMRKVQRHSSSQNPELRRAQEQNRSRPKARHPHTN